MVAAQVSGPASAETIASTKIQGNSDLIVAKKDKIEKAEFFGLLFCVGIPLPGTGGWTGSLIAALIDMDKKKALCAITLGVILAGLIVGSLSFGLLKGILG